ncbi:hypothetical protein M8C21_017959 [Ambrosia artemisiifolia]|uniref:Uncharacterized protein n=1 Tax=Ambrosia artemisiifolia TaxID=4212 RepID=A0AAD5G6T1_AMBAR|nr:hypothetical protein M8C21_017959 [Ambrosia artemisiifolia]
MESRLLMEVNYPMIFYRQPRSLESSQDVVDISNLYLVYTLSGVDCIDCATDVGGAECRE